MSSRRDYDREARLPPGGAELVERIARAYAQTGRVGALRWRTVYEALESGDVEPLRDFAAELEAEAKARAPELARARREEAALRRYERQGVEFDAFLPRAAQERRYAGQLLWLYHGTTSWLLDQILATGLDPDVEARAHDDTTPGYVYLTASPYGPASAEFYAKGAASRFGGEPVILRVLCPWEALEPDEDDADLACGRHQFRTTGPIRIMEVDGERIDHAASPRPRSRKKRTPFHPRPDLLGPGGQPSRQVPAARHHGR